VFAVPEYDGEPRESDEMAPVWTPVDAIPYDSMSADDRHWYPMFLRGARFRGLFAFRDTHALDWFELREGDAGDPALPAAALLPPSLPKGGSVVGGSDNDDDVAAVRDTTAH
jgi:hypothetical protein